MEYQKYDDVPWHRTSGANSIFLIIGLFIPPFIWIVAYMLATGDVYYDKTDEKGHLQKWSTANKIAAWVIIGIQLYFIAERYL